MKLLPNDNFITFRRGESVFSFLPSGDLREISCGTALVNQFLGTDLDGAVSGLWLRVYGEEGVKSYPMTGLRSGSSVSCSADRLVETGEGAGFSWKVTFYPANESVWLWDVELSGEGTVDVVYGQDLGMASRGGVLTNELYMSQYLGHSVFESDNGYVVCSRQNQPQPGFPYLRQGMLQGRAVHYSTDGMQFYGLLSKKSGGIEALSGDLCDENLQFEFAFTALQSEKLTLSGEANLIFYGLFQPDHTDAVRELEYDDELKAALTAYHDAPVGELKPVSAVRRSGSIGKPYCSPAWDADTAAKAYPKRMLEEEKEGELLSFFTPDYAHVALQQKELMVERPHGTIIISGISPNHPDERVFGATSYMYGLFAGQVVVGNTSFHKFLSTPRGLLNLQHNPGLRIYVKLDGAYRLLTLPAAYEMGRNYVRWTYELPGDQLVVTTFTSAEASEMTLAMKSASGKTYEALVTAQLCMGENEFSQPVEMEQLGDTLRFTQPEETRRQSFYPGLHFDMTVFGDYALKDDGVFFSDGLRRDGTLLTLATKGDFSILIQGRLEEAQPNPVLPSFEKELDAFRALFDTLKAGFKLHKAHDRQVDKLNAIAEWYTHNAMIHFASPHGLEQPGGAAWGTRDVCQGPFEYFMMTGNKAMMRETLLRIFAHQQLETGEWPQWFMFDRYPYNAGECHGDIVFWPLKCIGDYLAATGDTSILNEVQPYIHEKDGKKTEEQDTILDHVKRAADTVPESRFLSGTALVSYAGGDWDDTLQPADPAMKERLCSAWTQALAFQVLRNLAAALKPVDELYAKKLSETAQAIQKAFSELLIRDGVIAGFVRREEDGTLTPMLHPDDDFTGIHYRLLPMTRSIIAEMVDDKQAARNMAIIEDKLVCPDGVRLMGHPTRYDGGVSHLFRRAEQAANVGREVSLQYTHAHIRYIEALCKLGRGEKAWDAIFRITPIGITEAVPNALTRQSNLYFSSSDGCFPDRYSYDESFEKLRDGTIDVKGGWRLYSSGPGIYLHQLVSAMLGIRFEQDAIVIDPVLPASMDGLKFTFRCFGEEKTFVYCMDGKECLTRGGNSLDAERLSNRYRSAGWRLSRKALLAKGGVIEIHI